MLTKKPVHEFVEEVASALPAPGGGSVSALVGALGASLTSMVCRLTIGKKKYLDVQNDMEVALARAEQLRLRLTDLVEKDTTAFQAVMNAFTLPKETEEQKQSRSEAIQEATKGAAIVPLDVMTHCEQAIALVQTVAEKGNVNSITDAGVAALMINAACVGAALNVRINLGTLQDQDFVQTTQKRVDVILQSVQGTATSILQTVEQKLS